MMHKIFFYIKNAKGKILRKNSLKCYLSQYKQRYFNDKTFIPSDRFSNILTKNLYIYVFTPSTYVQSLR